LLRALLVGSGRLVPMLLWPTRLAAGVFVLVAIAMVISAVRVGAWQFWLAAACFVGIAYGWVRLGNHWREVNGATRVVQDSTTKLTALVMVAVFVVVSLSFATMG
ncbi:MAG: hypothetical protein Q4G64_06535, partial [bacterium]|nr:hypothetical protein [bacterium]